MSSSFKDRVAIVTGAGNGLGRAYALELARLGTRVVVNDLGGDRDGSGTSQAAAQTVVDEIVALGGDAIANTASVTDEAAMAGMAADAMGRWGRIDILINNAGILRDKSFSKMTIADFRLVVDVHLIGSAICTKAVWEIMRQQNYGRILMTTSATGLFGNFGQTNYGAAKLGLVGFMNSLGIEGQKNDIRVNTIAPAAATRMTEDVMPADVLSKMDPSSVVPAALYMVSEDAPNRTVLAAGAGGYQRSYLTLTRGVATEGTAPDLETLANSFAAISDRSNELVPENAFVQSAIGLGQL